MIGYRGLKSYVIVYRPIVCRMSHGRMMLKMTVLMVRHTRGKTAVPRPGRRGIYQEKRERENIKEWTGHTSSRPSLCWVKEMLRSFRTLDGGTLMAYCGEMWTSGLVGSHSAVSSDPFLSPSAAAHRCCDFLSEHYWPELEREGGHATYVNTHIYTHTMH